MASGEKFYATAAFPYPNSPQHIGHARTYTTTDVYVRYQKLLGKEVLFPMGFHVTGTPVIAMAKRLAAKDPELLTIFDKIYHIPPEKAQMLTDPQKLVLYFSQEIETGMKEMGYAIDWTRKFYTFDRRFTKFIRWQFRKLHEKGFLTRGSHPVPWCPRDNNALGAHDTKGDVDPEMGEYVLIKFRCDELEADFLAATFRPETTYGVTNIWIHPEAHYVIAEVEGSRIVISQETVEKFTFQGKDVHILETVRGETLLGKNVTNPLTGENVPLYPATFVDPANGTGIVMSVPAHAPFDYVALRDLNGTRWEYRGELRAVLSIEGYGRFPAKEIVEKMNIRNQQDPLLEDATKEIYSKEAHTGVMTVGAYQGTPVIRAKERIKEDLVREGKAFTLYEIINGPVYCRCGARGIVKCVENQWFIDYGNPEWKALARECLSRMRIIPPETRQKYEYTIEWLKEKPCVRAQGLGTRFPFDENLVIESLSDSTIYMAFYTIAHIIQEEHLPDDEKASDEIFDYIFLGKHAEKFETKEKSVYVRAREEFLKWYPLDSRHSGADLIHNHLTFFIFNHVAIFPPELWPKQIVVNGFVLMEGKKMSKSLMNILPLRDAIRKYSADVVRFAVVSAAELSQDSDFNEQMIAGINQRMQFMHAIASDVSKMKSEPPTALDGWLKSRFAIRAMRVLDAYENLQLRVVAQELFYSVVQDMRWYQKRGGCNYEVLKEILTHWAALLWPFMPTYTEKILALLGVPSIEEYRIERDWGKKIEPRAVAMEEIVVAVKEDIDAILKIMRGKRAFKPAHLTLVVAAGWKREVYALAAKQRRVDTTLKEVFSHESLKKCTDPQTMSGFVKKLFETNSSLEPLALSKEEETHALEDAKEFFKKEFELVSVQIIDEERATHPKAKTAIPLKPAIILEE